MKQSAFLISYTIMIAILLAGCNAANTGLFVKKTPKEKYEHEIEKPPTPAYLAWKKAGGRSLQNPILIAAPYKENTAILGDSSDATAFSFNVAGGQKIDILLNSDNVAPAAVFTELWEVAPGGERKLITAADTFLNRITHTTASGGNFIVTTQPTLQAKGNYTLHIALAPMLGFPIAQGVKANIGSIWGDSRDAGIRKHEGIDIFAKKGSAVVAVTDGTVQRVGDGGIGGKVVWFSPTDENFSVYYAHLDTQYVQSGQVVKQGEVLGTVGNTGNARYTPSHLHFGIYTNSGAINPLAFVQTVKTVADPAVKRLNERYKVNAKTKIYSSPSLKNATAINGSGDVKTVAFSNEFYRVVLADGSKGYIPANQLTEKMKL